MKGSVSCVGMVAEGDRLREKAEFFTRARDSEGMKARPRNDAAKPGRATAQRPPCIQSCNARVFDMRGFVDLGKQSGRIPGLSDSFLANSPISACSSGKSVKNPSEP